MYQYSDGSGKILIFGNGVFCLDWKSPVVRRCEAEQEIVNKVSFQAVFGLILKLTIGEHGFDLQ